MKSETFSSVWDALEDDPVQARNMKIRSELMSAITERIKAAGMNQQQAADKLKINQPRVSALVNGKIDQFRLDMLVNMALRLGLQVDLQVAA